MGSEKKHGVNMLDVKKTNRSAVLKLVQREKAISRKEIAVKLGLTPASITIIVSELLDEGVIEELSAQISPNRKGRREILLQISSEKYAAIGVYISRHKLRILCVDLNLNVLFETVVYTDECRKNANAILEKLVCVINDLLKRQDLFGNRSVVGLGVSVNGIVDNVHGVSINAFQVWQEANIPVEDILEKSIGLPVLLTNNICSLAHVESILSRQENKGSLLLIKYGPGLGAALSPESNIYSAPNYKAIQLGHIAADPNGAPCVCGDCGCFETIIHYDAVENHLKSILSERMTPVLWELTGGDADKVTIYEVIKAFDLREKVVEQIFDRTAFYLGLAIKNTLTLLDPDGVILYGELFENEKFKTMLLDKLTRFTEAERVRFSHYNMQLETLGPAATAVSGFFEQGGVAVH
ncbi:MAG: ROK family transcriptional regulator [Oscillospiraceae bacterium]|nr:ROK family transcriptional regulator [Oscillospiraceae bacterium]